MSIFPSHYRNDVKLLKFGRHSWEKDNLIVVGRNQEDNQAIKELSQKNDILIESKKFPGPTILIRAQKKVSEQSLIKAKELMIKYAPKLREKI